MNMFGNSKNTLVKKKVTVHGKNGDYQAFRNTKANEEISTPREKKSIRQDRIETEFRTEKKNHKKRFKKKKKFQKGIWNSNLYQENKEELTEVVPNFPDPVW